MDKLQNTVLHNNLNTIDIFSSYSFKQELLEVYLRLLTLNIHWKNWCWIWNSSILVIWCKRRLIGKVPDAGKDWGQKEKRASEDETTGLYHQCNEQEIGQTPGDGEGQGGLACCSPWSHTESDMTGQLNDHKKRLPGGARGKESVCQCRRCKRCGFDPWVKKIPWSKKWHPTPVFLPGKFHGQRSMAGYSPMGLWRVRHDRATEHTLI